MNTLGLDAVMVSLHSDNRGDHRARAIDSTQVKNGRSRASCASLCSSIVLCGFRWCIGIVNLSLVFLWCQRVRRFRRWFSGSKKIHESVYVSNGQSTEQSKSTHATNNLMKIVALVVRNVGAIASPEKHHAGYPPNDRLPLDPFSRRVFRYCFVQSESDGEDD